MNNKKIVKPENDRELPPVIKEKFAENNIELEII